MMETKAFLKAIGDKIRLVRKAQGMSQEKLAELSGLHPSFISYVETGKTNASIVNLYGIANALNVPLHDLLQFPSGKGTKKLDIETTEIISKLRSLDKKKQESFLTAAKCFLAGIEKS
jgi:transcriptional regulator with XRE-family HTH domain